MVTLAFAVRCVKVNSLCREVGLTGRQEKGERVWQEPMGCERPLPSVFGLEPSFVLGSFSCGFVVGCA